MMSQTMPSDVEYKGTIAHSYECSDWLNTKKTVMVKLVANR